MIVLQRKKQWTIHISVILLKNQLIINLILFPFKDPIVRDQGRPVNPNPQVLLSNNGKLDYF